MPCGNRVAALGLVVTKPSAGDFPGEEQLIVRHNDLNCQGRIHGLKSVGTNHGERKERDAEGDGSREVAMPLPRIFFFRFLSSKWQVLVHSGS